MPRQIEVTVTRAGPRSRPRADDPPHDPPARDHDSPRTSRHGAVENAGQTWRPTSARRRSRRCAPRRSSAASSPRATSTRWRPDAAPTRSELERRFRRLVRDAGLPPPEVNPQHGATLPDFRWPGERVIVETDGWAAHQGRAAFERDRARDADRTGDGWAVLRFTARQVDDRPAWVVCATRRDAQYVRPRHVRAGRSAESVSRTAVAGSASGESQNGTPRRA